jgi:flavin-dependent dehydrogenase
MNIAIIGCGVTGSYLAWKLALSGHRVTIFEKKQTIGKQVCSGLVSERLWNFIPEDESLIENSIDFAKIYFPGKTATVNFKQKILVLNHAKLDRYIAHLAEKAGAKIVHREIKTLPEGFDRVIGADGALSTTRKLLNLEDPKFKQGLQFFVKGKNSENFVETWPVESGFIWKIPRGNEVEYGVMSDMKTARKKLDDFCRKNSLKIDGLQAALIPFGLIVPDNEAITLCGDAAGLAKPWSGGGIIWSLTAADILLENFPDFRKYKRKLKMKFGFKIWQTSLITAVGYFLGKNIPWLLPKQREIDSDWLT